MSKKISEETMEKIVLLIEKGKNDQEIAIMTSVSVSYVNKLRSRLTELKAKKLAERESKSEEEISILDDIDILEAKIRSMKKSIIFFEELIAFKKENLKK